MSVSEPPEPTEPPGLPGPPEAGEPSVPAPEAPRGPVITYLGIALIVALIAVVAIGWGSRKIPGVAAAEPEASSPAPAAPSGPLGSFSGPTVAERPCCWQRWTMDSGAVSVLAPDPASYWTHPGERGVGFQGATGANLSVSEDVRTGSPASLVAGTAQAIRAGSTLHWSRPTPIARNGFTGARLHTIVSKGGSKVDFTIWLFASPDRLYTIQAQFIVHDAGGEHAVQAFLDSVRLAAPH
jgi:hypothetical protein